MDIRNSQLDDIQVEVFRRNLTKRQKALISMIHALSCSMDKEEAIIPQLKDFELCGVGKSKIKGELTKLKEMKIITWHEGFNTYKINDPVKWKAPMNPLWDVERFEEVYDINNREKIISKDQCFD